MANDCFIAAPDLLIEVVSPGNGNRSRDFVHKKQLDNQVWRQGILACGSGGSHCDCVARLDAETFNVTLTFTSEEELTSSLLPGFEFNVAGLFNLQ